MSAEADAADIVQLQRIATAVRSALVGVDVAKRTVTTTRGVEAATRAADNLGVALLTVTQAIEVLAPVGEPNL